MSDAKTRTFYSASASKQHTVQRPGMENLRVVYLPDGPCKIIRLKSPISKELVNLVVSSGKLYELRELTGDNPFDPQNHLRPVTKADGQPVRSLILSDPEGNGVVIENGSLVVATLFNLSYLLIAYFTDAPSGRFQGLEDIVDSLQAEYEGFAEVGDDMVAKSLEQICNTVVEGDETFYKFDESMALLWLKQRVQRLCDHFPSSILESLIKPLLYPVELDKSIPEDMMALALQKYSVLLLSSYLTEQWVDKLMKCYELEPLEQYIGKIKQQKAAKRAAEQSLLEVNQLNANNKRSTKPVAKAAPKKKVKVAKVTKGALDMFFKKKA